MGILKRLVGSNGVIFGLFCTTCLVAGIVSHTQSTKAWFLVFLIGFGIIGAVLAIDAIFFTSEDVPKSKSADGLGEEIIIPGDEMTFRQRIDTPLEYLVAVGIAEAKRDELAELAYSISMRATRLLGYRIEDGVIGEVLSAYRSFIDQYVAKAAELVKKYRKAQEHLDSSDPKKLTQTITNLKEEIKQGSGSLQATLNEKERTLRELGQMCESQATSLQELGEIDATLEAMETIAVSADTNNSSEHDIRAELQRTISSTTLAIKETLCPQGH